MRSRSQFFMALAVILWALAATATNTPKPRYFSPATLAAARVLPAQDGGRVKPLDTKARFFLLRLQGKRTMRFAGGVKLAATEWFLECLFFPEKVVDYPTFLLDDSEVLSELGIPAHAKRRSRYSYSELEPGIAKLYEKANAFQQIASGKRTNRQRMIVNLATNVHEFERLIHNFDVARLRLDLASATTDLPLQDNMSAAAVLAQLPALRRHMVTARQAEQVDVYAPVEDALLKVARQISTATDLAIFPPAAAATDTWLTVGDLLAEVFDNAEPPPSNLRRLQQLEALADARTDPARFEQAFLAFQQDIAATANERNEYRHIELETQFYKSDLFYRALVCYVLAFLTLAFSWLAPGSKLGKRLTVAACLPLAVGLGAHVLGIVLRCIIRGRPPVSTLYETILFISASSVIVLLLIEWANRRRIALAMASVLGCLGLFLAIKYEMKEAVDTMPTLVAVLDTNFWLATHVTVVVLGYSAGLVAGALSHVYLGAYLFNFKFADDEFRQTITRMVYGVICFGMLFSFVGTVLGGIWANDSWGRFWGWDPKENGALMIVLWNAMILHLRMGGYVREFGVHVMAVSLGIIVSFSWWGVNLLEVGLHSYGFTSGVKGALYSFYGIEYAVIVISLGVWLRRRLRATPTAKA